MQYCTWLEVWQHKLDGEQDSSHKKLKRGALFLSSSFQTKSPCPIPQNMGTCPFELYLKTEKCIVHDHFLLLIVVNCGTLTNPVNGQVHYTGRTTFGQTVNYTCDLGYILVGGRTRTCHSTGRWSGSAPTCQGMLLLDLVCVSCKTV